jgi:heme exporter protein D
MTGNTITEYFAMGGYATYVWGSFGLSFIVILGNIIAAQRLRRRVLSEIAQVNRVIPKTFSEVPASDTQTMSAKDSS